MGLLFRVYLMDRIFLSSRGRSILARTTTIAAQYTKKMGTLNSAIGVIRASISEIVETAAMQTVRKDVRRTTVIF